MGAGWVAGWEVVPVGGRVGVKAAVAAAGWCWEAAGLQAETNTVKWCL